MANDKIKKALLAACLAGGVAWAGVGQAAIVSFEVLPGSSTLTFTGKNKKTIEDGDLPGWFDYRFVGSQFNVITDGYSVTGIEGWQSPLEFSLSIYDEHGNAHAGHSGNKNFNVSVSLSLAVQASYHDNIIYEEWLGPENGGTSAMNLNFRFHQHGAGHNSTSYDIEWVDVILWGDREGNYLEISLESLTRDDFKWGGEYFGAMLRPDVVGGYLNRPPSDQPISQVSEPSEVPEPGILALLAAGGLLGLGFLRRRRPVTASGAASAN